MALNERSKNNLIGVHPDLVRVVERAAEISPVPFVVTEGLRNLERQRALKAAGKSWTLDSRHLTGHAVDLVDADNFGYDMPDLTVIAKAMRQASSEFGVPIKWGANVKHGGDFKSVNDSPHFELDAAAYPASGISLTTKAKEIAGKVLTSRPVVGLATGGTAATVASTQDSAPVPPSAPAIPTPPSLEAYSGWKSFMMELSSLWQFAGQNKLITAGVILWVLACMFLVPKLVRKT